RALRIDPGSAEAWCNRGNVLGEIGRYAAALAGFDRALAIDSRHAEAWYNRGIALGELQRHDEAPARFDRALALDAGIAYCLGNALHARMTVCDWAGLELAFARAVAEIDRGFPAITPFVSLGMPLTARQQKRCAEIYVEDACGAAAPAARAAAARSAGANS